MKSYLNFGLTGKDFFPIWILFYILFVLPYAFLIINLQSFNSQGLQNQPSYFFFAGIILLVIVALVFAMYFAKIIVEKISFNEVQLQCNYSVNKYIGLILTGVLLSIITIGIYIPWFIKRLSNFFVDNTSYKDHNFSFRGKGGDLFIIITVSLIIPFVVLAYILFRFYNMDAGSLTGFAKYFYQAISYFIMIPYMYLSYKWLVDIKYKDYHIKWDTMFFPSVGKFALEFLLTFITAGIYAPMACLRLYKYFIHKTRSNEVGSQYIRFGFDENFLKDFLFIWGQALLTLITLGVYYPWALCKISGRILGKTYIEKQI